MSFKSSKESATGTSHHSWERCPNTTPMSFTYSFRCFHGFIPLIWHWPLSGTRMPDIILMVLLFPAPLGPIYVFPLTDMKGDILQRVDGFIFPVEQGSKSSRQTRIPPGHPVCLADMLQCNHVFILRRKPVWHFSIKFLFYSLKKKLSTALK